MSGPGQTTLVRLEKASRRPAPNFAAESEENGVNEQIPGRRNKLGLALAGGGFRASLFHLGVLRRMAELDLLRYVEVLSTVSGGSIIGALYALLLKKRLEKAETGGRLGRDAYLALVDELQQTLITGIQKNLRLRLFRNPLGILRVLITPQSLGRRMARLYERHLYRSVVDELEPGGWWRSKFRPGRIPLRRIRIDPGGSKMGNGIEAYNREVVAASVNRAPDEPPGSVVTKLVLNATSLNSGARFWFASSEIGDWFLGHFRHSEVRDLLRRKPRSRFEARNWVATRSHLPRGGARGQGARRGRRHPRVGRLCSGG
jgi:hypothetical protein